jgi:hypothetical protein
MRREGFEFYFLSILPFWNTYFEFEIMSFAFWKKSKPVETDTATDNAAPPARDPPAVPTKPDLKLKDMDSGAFSFDDMERLAQCSPTTPFQKLLERVKPSVVAGHLDDDAAELDDEGIQSRCATPEDDEEREDEVAAIAVPTRIAPLPPTKEELTVKSCGDAPTRVAPVPPTKDEAAVHSAPSRVAPPPPVKEELAVAAPSRMAPLPPTKDESPVQSLASAPTRSPPMPPSTDTSRADPSLSAPLKSPPSPPVVPQRPSRSFTPPSRTAPMPPPKDQSQSQSNSIFSRPTSTISQVESSPRRLHRPTELNLSTINPSTSKPPSELEKQFSLMRNSMTRSKAALRSPTELLNLRMSMSSKKAVPEEKVRVFAPPQPSTTGCLFPGPAGQIAFTSSSVRASTSTGRPAWWCKFDKLVVFDGIDSDDKIHVRTSRGLSIARRRGQTETVVIPMDCVHCQDMLKRREWTYDIQVCKRSVCWDCKERCKWERKQEIKEAENKKERDRERANSVLQDDEGSIEGLEEIDERLVGIAL